MLEQSTGIGISKSLAEKMLISYRSEEGHLYKAASLMNLPWIFGYMANAQCIARQTIKNNPVLVEHISAQMEQADISEDGPGKGVIKSSSQNGFLDLNISFIHHTIIKRGQTIEESMRMVVFTHENKDSKTVYEDLIRFDPDHFLALINVPEDRAYRPRKASLVALAEKILR